MSWGLMGRVGRHAAQVPGLCLEMVVVSMQRISWTYLFCGSTAMLSPHASGPWQYAVAYRAQDDGTHAHAD